MKSVNILLLIVLATQSDGTVEYTDWIFSEGYDPTPPTSVLDKTLNSI